MFQWSRRVNLSSVRDDFKLSFMVNVRVVCFIGEDPEKRRILES